jgi:hypothetical protein
MIASAIILSARDAFVREFWFSGIIQKRIMLTLEKHEWFS